jgi:diguanylate cyclase (GGDEF)-like protein/PAS domain S-box-containing protein
VNPYSPDKRGHENGLWNWNLKARRIHFSAGWIAMLGYERDEVGNAPDEWFRRIHPEDLKRVQSEVDATLAGKSTQFENQHRMLHKEGTYRWMSCRGVVSRNKKGRAVHLAGFHSDITAEKAADALTGLPDRFLFLDRLESSIERAKHHSDYFFAVLLLDIDRFSSVVEKLGPRTADQLLIAVARRLETSLQAGDTVARLGCDHIIARLGGDEFTILLDSLREAAEARSIAERLLMEISAAFELGGQEVFLSASIGIALSLSGYIPPEDALRDADIALQRAKSLGTARCEVFDLEVLDKAETRFQLEDDLHEAMAQNELSIAYQPVISLVSNQIAGFEALVRWNHPVRGAVPPAEFIPIAERTGLIFPLSRWILYQACQQMKNWQAQLRIPSGLWVAVNFSPLQFKQRSLVRQIGEILRDIDLDPSCLMLELTESVVTEDPQAIGGLLMQLRGLGVRIGIDDFGTGYSSLSYLRQLPVDFLKIDHAFVRRMEISEDLTETTRTIGSLAHQSGLRVIAGGIENEEELNLVRSLNCEYAQGRLFSKPVDNQKAEALLKTGLPQMHGTGPGNERAGDDAATACQPSQGNLRPTATDQHFKWPLIGQKSRGLVQRVGPVVIVSAAAMFVLAAAGVIKFAGRTTPPSAATPQAGLQAIAQGRTPAVSAQDPLDKAASPGAKSKSAGDANEAPSGTASRLSAMGKNKQAPARSEGGGTPASTPVKAATGKSLPSNSTVKSHAVPAAQPLNLSFPVIHNHGLGSCTGILRISQDTLSWNPEKQKDGFVFKCSEFSYAASNDQLTIKSGTRTFRFKPMAVRENGESRTRLQSMIQGISSACPTPR